ncbi:MAG: hypothetical protein IJ955_02485 [Oscillospiraceae bacterium]|nr:hypothetical protein [Oscillospiraceae bacterium]
MSHVIREYKQQTVYSGLVVDVAEDSLDRVTSLLSGIEGGVYKAVGSALARAASAGKTVAKRQVTKEYNISQSDFLKYTSRNINHFNSGRAAGGHIYAVVFGFRGYVIPLTKFDTRINSNGQIVTRVKRSSMEEVLNKAFFAQTRHRGVYERIGDERLPIRELFGPATPQMMYSNEAVMDEVEHTVAETYEKRIDHEILRILNGWGK